MTGDHLGRVQVAAGPITNLLYTYCSFINVHRLSCSRWFVACVTITDFSRRYLGTELQPTPNLFKLNLVSKSVAF